MTTNTTTAEKDTVSSGAEDSTTTEQSFTVNVVTFKETVERDTYTNVKRFVRGPASSATLEFVSGEEKRLGSVFQFEGAVEEANR